MCTRSHDSLEGINYGSTPKSLGAVDFLVAERDFDVLVTLARPQQQTHLGDKRLPTMAVDSKISYGKGPQMTGQAKLQAQHDHDHARDISPRAPRLVHCAAPRILNRDDDALCLLNIIA